MNYMIGSVIKFCNNVIESMFDNIDNTFGGYEFEKEHCVSKDYDKLIQEFIKNKIIFNYIEDDGTYFLFEYKCLYYKFKIVEETIYNCNVIFDLFVYNDKECTNLIRSYTGIVPSLVTIKQFVRELSNFKKQSLIRNNGFVK